jgi:hypothetical protein
MEKTITPTDGLFSVFSGVGSRVGVASVGGVAVPMVVRLAWVGKSLVAVAGTVVALLQLLKAKLSATIANKMFLGLCFQFAITAPGQAGVTPNKAG